VSLLFLDLGVLLLAGLERRERGLGAGWTEREGGSNLGKGLGPCWSQSKDIALQRTFNYEERGHNGAELDQAGQQLHQDVENLTRNKADSS